MRFPTAKFTEIAKTSILIILILNFFIIFFEIKYIEYIYLIIFLLFSFSLIFIQKINIKLSLNFFKEIVKIFFISAIIYYLPIASVQLGKFFYIF